MAYPSSLMSAGSGSEGMNLEVWFPQPNEVTVFLESSFTDPDDERLYETMLFALFAARHIANGRGSFTYASLAETLFSLDEHEPLPGAAEALKEVGATVGSPSVAGGRKGFTCTLRPEKRGFFKLHPHGFGMLGKGVDYYAPTSTLALLVWLLSRRVEDDRYHLALGMTAKMIGAAGASGQISVTSQAEIAMQASGAGWFHPDDMIPEGEEVSDEVREICREHEIEFGQLYAEARRQIEEAFEEVPGEGEMLIIEVKAATRACRVIVASAAELIDEDPESPLNVAARLLQTAKETDDEKMIEGAYSYYDKQLGDAIEEAGLTPVVEALEGMILDKNPEEAERG